MFATKNRIIQMKAIKLKSGKEISLKRRHPWVFSGAIAQADDNIAEGEKVSVLSSSGELLGIGHFQPQGSISARILTFSNEKIDAKFWVKRINSALEARKSQGIFSEETSIFRLIHGEGDFLPGLIIDIYGDTAVIQCHTLGMHLETETISQALQQVFGDSLKAIYDKSGDLLKNHEHILNRYLFQQENTSPAVYLEHGIAYSIDWERGQKTGFFIDQRENRLKLQQYCKGKKVLNTFCYSGGFSLAALKAGAEKVVSVDSSAEALKSLEVNLTLNSFVVPKRHESLQADVIKTLKEIPGDFEVIVLDPPAFAKNRKSKHQAVQAYKRLNKVALERIASGGILFTFSCSQVIDKELFRNSITAAAMEVNRNIRIIDQLHQPGDHPVNICHPEGEYLKGLVVHVEK
jgi:23S rRNA (cytosine1962-C5)-methyltransferase